MMNVIPNKTTASILAYLGIGMDIAEIRERFTPSKLKCAQENCPKTAKEGPMYFYGKETLCREHLKEFDPDYLYQLDMADKEARNTEESSRYHGADFGSRKEIKRPVAT